ncbi:MAG TPA: hypothetical protein VIM98_13555 [Dyella sp.]|uniref:hypothetical protein n=1 Tax=Dyella sp. TaxID=1869338 RepID=UPI002F938C71
MAELDAGFGNDRGHPGRQRGWPALGKSHPYRLIVPREKRPARWIRDVSGIEVIDMATRPAKTIDRMLLRQSVAQA